MHNDIERILISEEEIKAKIAELGKQLTADYAGKDPIFIGILRGVVVFFSDMIRAIDTPCRIDFMAVSSYGAATESSGRIIVKKDFDLDISGRHVVILEDIIDSGLTLKYVMAYMQSKNPASLKVCTLLDKPDRRKVDVQADYVGFTVPNEFVVGYGLDYNDYYRNLPYVGILKPEVYQK